MKKLVFMAILLGSVISQAETTISAAVKQSVVADTSSNTTSGAGYTKGASFGVVISAVPSDALPISVGAGVFQDQTGMLLLGIRFK